MHLTYRLWPDAAKYGNISETAWRRSSQFAVRSTLMEVRRMLTISMYCNHNAAVRLVPLVWSRWVLARCWMTSRTPVALASSRRHVWWTFWPGTGCMRWLRSLLAQLIPLLPFSRRVTTSFTLSSDFWQIGQVISSSNFKILEGLKIIRTEIRLCQVYLIDLVVLFLL